MPFSSKMRQYHSPEALTAAAVLQTSR